MQVDKLSETLESFGIDADAVSESDVESVDDFVEWMEKTNGDLELSLRLYPLGAEFPTPDNPDDILNPFEWRHQDPAPGQRTTFKCPNCNDEFTLVETTGMNRFGSDLLALSEHGRLDDYRYILDPAGAFYNYGHEEYPNTDYSHLCGECKREIRSHPHGFHDHFPSRIRLQTKGYTVDVNHNNHVAYRPPEYFKIPQSERDMIDAKIQYNDTPNGWTKIYPNDGATDARLAHENSNIRAWIQSWASKSEKESDEYHFDFPSVVGYGCRGYRTTGGFLYVPDDPEAVEEANEWIDGPAADYSKHRHR